ncbi:pyridoxal phosphate-dependent decarboxylase family protein [Altibacter sp. HG106]|uniref:pyridoxal phosphate-dependent decarboxylase family protein n=1 Tax=Altibacter sp. HG106 TaxID=3023937 RepID=UPI002350F30C|nr:aminotransferase class V-fold PLP-dependent enzyme [Altibacter sp. HG106]MDC7995343.1 aminotransferase class V-fold PLP-dependent enzyme [Altibacter sp. HG106]
MRDTLQQFQKLATALLQDEATHPVADFIPADTLYDALDLSLQKEGISEEVFEEALQELVFKTPRTATSAFFNQLFGGRNEKAVLGELLAVLLNNSMYTYKAAGPQIGVEKVVLRKVCELLDWDAQSDGTLAPGGSMTNYMAMVMARDAVDSATPYQGIQKKMTVYTSSESHYSIPKNAAFSGIGRDQVRYVPTNDFGQMNADALAALVSEDIAKGFTPIMVNATAGTTVLGAFDAIPPLRAICDEHKMWLHVDGAYCGSVMFSDTYKHLIKGVSQVDSFSFNAHKMIGTPLSCSIIVVKDKKHLYNSFSNDASYLYQTDHDEFNLGKTSLQCGRRNDALKFWTLWKSVGTNGLQNIVDHQFYLADVAREYIRNNEDYTLYSYEESISICFNYKNIPARVLCTALYEQEALLVGYGSFRTEEFIRLVTINAQNEKEDILHFFQTLEQFVEQHQSLLAEPANS